MNVLDQFSGKNFHIYNADCVEFAQNMPSDSIGYSIYSPPFASLYTFSNSERDMSNCASHGEFMEQYQFLIDQLFRVTKPGRLTSVHCTNMTTTKSTHGKIGLIDFRGQIIRAHEAAGWTYHSEVVIWKNPVMAMQRTKALGLLHKTITTDSGRSRQGTPDYILTFRKEGENDTPIEGRLRWYAGDMSLNEFAEAYGHNAAKSGFKVSAEFQDGICRQLATTPEHSIDIWQQYASPVWFDIHQSNTLEFRKARDSDDEKHISPLQLDVIERCLQLWSMPGDVVYSPFLGIGSEGYVSLSMLDGARKFIGTELKSSYFKAAIKNLQKAENQEVQTELF